RSDGTPEGTVLLAPPLVAGPPLGEHEIVAAGNTVFFAGADSAGDLELWKTDGTDAGTLRVKDINSEGSSYPGLIAAVGGLVFFVADDGISGRELWRSDGTPEGTFQLADVNPGPDPGVFQGSFVFRGVLYFLGFNPELGVELWRSDGTREGT